MPKLNKLQTDKRETEIVRAYNLYQEIPSLRKVGKLMEKSHDWVRTALNEYEEYLQNLTDKKD